MNRILLLLLVLVGLAFLIGADVDNDGLDDLFDAGTADAGNTANFGAAGCDTDGDGYGNRTDGDFNQSGTVTSADYSMFFVPALGGPDPGEGEDMNCDGGVTSADYSMFFTPQLGGVPGPSGIPCASENHQFCRANQEARSREIETAGGFSRLMSEPIHWPGETGSFFTDPHDTETPSGYPYSSRGLDVMSPTGQFWMESHVESDSTSLGIPFAWQVPIYRNVYDDFQDTPFIRGAQVSINGDTACYRINFKYTSGFANSLNDPDDVILAQNLTVAADGTARKHPGIQFRWKSGTLHLLSGLENTDFGAHGTGDDAFSGDGVSRANCANHSCRFEYCLDHNVASDNKLDVRARLVQTSGNATGHTDTVSVTLPNAVTLPMTGFRNDVYYGEILTPDSWALAGTDGAWIWNAMLVQYGSFNTSFWIGPVYESEGGGAGY